MTQVTVNGNTYSDDGTTAKDMLGKGYATHFFPLLNDVIVRVGDAEDAAVAADASADLAAAYAAALSSTSTTSTAVGSGSKTLTTQSGKQYAAGQKVIIARTSDSAIWMYGAVTSYSSTTLIVNVSDYDGSGTYTDWTISVAGIKGATGVSGASAPRLEKTSAYTIGSSDKGKVIVATSGTWSFTFSACSTLTSGWYAWVFNDGTGTITLDPNSTEQIDGGTTLVMYPGERRFVYCTGTALYTFIEKPFYATFTSSGTLTVPPGYKGVGAFLIGGGSGGGSGERRAAGVASLGGTGGGGGGAVVGDFTVTAAEALTITVGAGGPGGTARTTDGATNAGTIGGSTEITDGTNAILKTVAAATAQGYGYPQIGAGIRTRSMFSVVPATEEGYVGGFGGDGDDNAPEAAYSSSTAAGPYVLGKGGPGGGGGAGVSAAGTHYAGAAGGLRASATQGGGGAGGTAGGGAGGTASNAGGGGGGGNNAGTGGTGGAGTGYGSGGGGGGGVQGAYTSGAGGAGADGVAYVWGVL
jgi:hypothetical protein